MAKAKATVPEARPVPQAVSDGHGGSYSQLSCLMLGMKLQTASKLPDGDAARQLLTVSKEIREALITLGLRKRKVRKAS